MAIKSTMDAGVKNGSRTTIFHQLLDPDATEGHVVPSVDNMRDESFVILSAATDTTGNAMTVAMYEVATNSAIYAKLAAELNAAFPDPSVVLDFVTLEKLPYLVSISLTFSELPKTLNRLLLLKKDSGMPTLSCPADQCLLMPPDCHTV